MEEITYLSKVNKNILVLFNYPNNLKFKSTLKILHEALIVLIAFLAIFDFE